MPFITVILLLASIYITVDLRFVPSNEGKVQKALEIISDDFGEENRQLAYNKSALLVRKKRVAAILVTVLTTIGVQYICRVLATATPFDNGLKRWALKYWGFRDGHETVRYKKLATFVVKTVMLDADGNLDEIRDFVDIPPGWETQVETFHGEATLTMTEMMADEVIEQARMNQENQKTPERGINAPVLLSKIKKVPDLEQITKAMVVDHIIFTLLSINAMGETTWKVNPNNRNHRNIYETLLRIKAAIDRKYKDRCTLKKFTAKELPELKAWYVRLLGAVLPDWLSNVFSGVKAAEHKKIKVGEEQNKTIGGIYAMGEEDRQVRFDIETSPIAKQNKKYKLPTPPQNPNMLNNSQVGVNVGKGRGRKEAMQQPGLKIKLKQE